MAANKALAIRVDGRFKRASAPKSRNGCLTCRFRHLKCDEAKPVCQRCQDDKMKCDGYLPPKPRVFKGTRKNKEPKTQAVTVVNPPIQRFDQTPLLADPERLHLQHFLHWTAKQLSTSSAATNFWLCYALPMSYQFDAIRYSMIAVGASHRAFMSHSLGFGRPEYLQRPVIQHYNRAISSILPMMSSPTQGNMHCILICCMLFITCEGLTGRYDELLKHLAAGDMILRSLQDPTTAEESTMTEKLVSIFSQLCLESSDFMKDPNLPGIQKWCSKDAKHSVNDIQPFESLDDASHAIHKLRLLHDFAPQDPDRENGRENDKAFQGALNRWDMRFRDMAERDIFHWTDEEMSQYYSLQLLRRYFQMYIDSYADQEWENPTDQTILPFLETAELVAAPLIGIYDSNDVAEMHTLAAMDMGDWGSCCSDSDDESVYGELDPPLTSPVGIPAMIEGLARKAGVTSKRLECFS
ncbi:unnamed protein product [Fusarium graminearum]|uniref:Chromosome 4, complete genome n=1 Tax=Gibberella zeae (strain ATCC MYA-4620 / CBS 123657 / FGSC 9075 / NRRL 31084 / PH-1) TaxID=229533 RepID=A0A098DRD7_GIBZE|nr:unnamed protein product [Fusarium graminearum]